MGKDINDSIDSIVDGIKYVICCSILVLATIGGGYYGLKYGPIDGKRTYVEYNLSNSQGIVPLHPYSGPPPPGYELSGYHPGFRYEKVIKSYKQNPEDRTTKQKYEEDMIGTGIMGFFLGGLLAYPFLPSDKFLNRI